MKTVITIEGEDLNAWQGQVDYQAQCLNGFRELLSPEHRLSAVGTAIDVFSRRHRHDKYKYTERPHRFGFSYASQGPWNVELDANGEMFTALNQYSKEILICFSAKEIQAYAHRLNTGQTGLLVVENGNVRGVQGESSWQPKHLPQWTEVASIVMSQIGGQVLFWDMSNTNRFIGQPII